MKTLQKMAKICDPNRIMSRDRLEDPTKIHAETNRFKKEKPSGEK